MFESQQAFAIFSIIVGVIVCFWGYRLFKVVLGIAGFIAGAALFYHFGAQYTERMIVLVILALFGGLDMQVPAEGNLEAMREALSAAGNPDFQVDQLAGLNHFFQSAETGAPDEYGRLEETISPRVLEQIADWILERAERD